MTAGKDKSMIRRRIVLFACLFISLSVGLRAEVGDENLVMGNPSHATSDASNTTNYLMRKAEYVLSYNASTASPNWVSWHLNASWIGDSDRQDDFRSDTSLPAGWFRVAPKDYTKTGFDKGHMCNSKDRTASTNANSTTFLMTNMIPQSPRNNEQTWKNLEDFCRKLALSSNSNELYIICGPAGKGGVGGRGKRETIAAHRQDGIDGAITVPASTWKVVLVLPHNKCHPDDVTTNSTTIAVCVPNTQSVTPDWTAYVTTVSDIETQTGFTFFGTIDPTVASVIKNQRYGPKFNFRGRSDN